MHTLPMQPLDRTVRRDLETAIKGARRVAERGAAKAIDALAVGNHEPWSGQPVADRTLRRKLRERGRQLGDVRDNKTEKQTTARLVHEVAYEHWHRMLFARFLAEIGLLIEPESKVAIGLADCRELAKEQRTDVWTLASRYAQTMLPEIFRPDDPVLAVQLAREDEVELEAILEGLSRDVFISPDALGWSYQFWQAEKKEAVNASGVKIGAEELPAVTQLFTEDYMVDFLLDNTLGAWWAGKVLAANPSLGAGAATEADLRKAVSLPGVPWNYLRFIKDDHGIWRPAAGTFDGWPTAAKDLTCLDPCMGSGHFVVAMFDRLVPLRIREEGLDEKAAIQAVIRDNLFGLEIDPRCTQIGAFNLALAAWRRVGYCLLPPMNIACSGLAPNATEEQWVTLAGGVYKLEEGMRRLYALFKDAPVLGSLINPRAEGYAAFEASFAELQPILAKALAKEGSDDAEHEMAVTARGVAKAAEILGRQFTLVATNVPYLGRKRQARALKAYCTMQHRLSHGDLASSFVDRCLKMCSGSGSAALITPHQWLFLGNYKKFREHLLKACAWNAVARLGPSAFETIGGEVVNVAAICLSASTPSADQSFFSCDVSAEKSVDDKSRRLLITSVRTVTQSRQQRNPDSRITCEDVADLPLLNLVSESLVGIQTGDYPRFVLSFWERANISTDWEPYSRAGTNTLERSEILLWQKGTGALLNFVREKLGEGAEGAWLRGAPCWGKRGVAVNLMGGLVGSAYEGQKFDQTLAVILPRRNEHLPGIYAFVSSPEFVAAVRAIDQKLNLTNATLGKVPFDLVQWQRIAAERFPDGLPAPNCSDPTQWLFNGQPKGSDNPLHVAVARLVGYQWPRQTGSDFPDCPALGPDGLEKHADADGIVCLSSVRGEPSAADRLIGLLAEAYGPDWSGDVLAKLLADVDAAGKSLDDWLRDGFFEQHVALFHQRPFVWHVWDGLRDGFHALVNYHRLAGPDGQGSRTLQKLTFEYLGDWIARQKAAYDRGEEGAEARLTAATHLQEQLKKIIEGEPPFDIFVRWKPLHEQPIGWHPDINDGVRINIRPFMTARPLGARARAACILRTPPRIKWDKDRGKEPDRPKADFPWFWKWDESTADFAGGAEFDGCRHNDLHYSRACKEKAREKAGSATAGTSKAKVIA
jgi:hypothetical protein